MLIKKPKRGERCPVFDTIRRAFPSYRERKIFLIERTPLLINAYWWDGGSRSEYYTANIDGSNCQPLPVPNGPPPLSLAALPLEEISEGRVILTKNVRCGKPATATIYSNPADKSYWGVATALGV